MLTPGAYLKCRRTAQGLSVADVAAWLKTDPRTPEFGMIKWIEFIEADVMPASFTTIVALRQVYRFDLEVLSCLEAIAQGYNVPPPRLCRICACSRRDPCNDHGRGCAWVETDLCTVCAPDHPASAALTARAA